LSSVDPRVKVYRAPAPQTECCAGQNQLYLLALSPFPSSFCLEQVPDAIKSQYQFPPPLIAPAAIRDGELICNGIPEESQAHLLNSEHLATQAEQQEVSDGRAGIPNPIFCLTRAIIGSILSVYHSHFYPTPTQTPQELSISSRTSGSNPKDK
jgi:hypothetical protein